eukprot:7858287-Pyramimonas_sp.AAC.1
MERIREGRDTPSPRQSDETFGTALLWMPRWGMSDRGLLIRGPPMPQVAQGVKELPSVGGVFLPQIASSISDWGFATHA